MIYQHRTQMINMDNTRVLSLYLFQTVKLYHCIYLLYLTHLLKEKHLPTSLRTKKSPSDVAVNVQYSRQLRGQGG